VGHSGSGKSTIIKLLFRYYDPDFGTIMIDGKRIQDYDLTELRRCMALVPQEIMLFGGTIYDNIAYGRPESSESEVKEAARKANALEFIESFPDGFNTVVGERGMKLSGGQKQRIAIARAIIRNPSILILDEATSALDAENEKLVKDALEKLMEGRTTFIIAHRLSTIRQADRIFVLRKGRVVEQGSHLELMKKPDSIYVRLVQLQYDEE
ncbi:MAG: ATP-binding cassette domain-containing protein, partial [Chitinophagales bacterium]|nr:ATP-binding cassette domain-containing protein [Chitinophagales bacterium]